MKEATKRIGQASADIAPLPEMDWRVREINGLLDQETFQKNYTSIPINNELYYQHLSDSEISAAAGVSIRTPILMELLEKSFFF